MTFKNRGIRRWNINSFFNRLCPLRRRRRGNLNSLLMYFPPLNLQRDLNLHSKKITTFKILHSQVLPQQVQVEYVCGYFLSSNDLCIWVFTVTLIRQHLASLDKREIFIWLSRAYYNLENVWSIAIIALRLMVKSHLKLSWRSTGKAAWCVCYVIVSMIVETFPGHNNRMSSFVFFFLE